MQYSGAYQNFVGADRIFQRPTSFVQWFAAKVVPFQIKAVKQRVNRLPRSLLQELKSRNAFSVKYRDLTVEQQIHVAQFSDGVGNVGKSVSAIYRVTRH